MAYLSALKEENSVVPVIRYMMQDDNNVCYLMFACYFVLGLLYLHTPTFWVYMLLLVVTQVVVKLNKSFKTMVNTEGPDSQMLGELTESYRSGLFMTYGVWAVLGFAGMIASVTYSNF